MIPVDTSAFATKAKEVAATVLAPRAADDDKAGRFSSEAVRALGNAGLLGLLVPAVHGGTAAGPRALVDVTVALAEADPSAAMVYLMHSLGTAVIAAAPPSPELAGVLRDIAGGSHLTTLAFSEAGSRSHFWSPVSKAESLNGSGVRISARKSWVTSAGFANSYVVSSLSPNAQGPTDSTLYLVPLDSKGLSVSGTWDGLGLRANASNPMQLEGCIVPDHFRLVPDATGFGAMLQTVLPLFNVGQAAVGLGICRATIAATITHLKTARFDHLDTTLGAALPTLRAQLATMQMRTDQLTALLDDTVHRLETPDALTMLRVLEVKAVAGDAAIEVTSLGMRTCGGAAFSRHTAIERYFRDAHAGAVMAPTTDVLKEFIGKSLLDIPLF
ncbi:MAG: acyl-CoA dehydrogenase family protein [Vicinamibacterales bacterium]